MTEKNTPIGRPWTDAGYFDSYELAKQKVEKITSDELQTKIRRRSNGTYLVKYRKLADLVATEEKKSGKNKRRNKKTPSGGKFDASTVV